MCHASTHECVDGLQCEIDRLRDNLTHGRRGETVDSRNPSEPLARRVIERVGECLWPSPGEGGHPAAVVSLSLLESKC